ncbi:MAG: GTPase Era [Firmicutes bacterium]|nr:GTPase Era [Bacillota bacterium]MBR3052501.1 GTPase Era [Bacillota bacterium]MCR4668755.1 GTPase Era [Clostridia bacterium]
MRSGFVGIIGRPNVGKSTLMNCIVGEKVAITTDKPQTTRNTIRGIYTREGLQIVFIDTPGIHKAKNKLGQAMTQAAINTFKQVDALLFLVDGSPERGTGDTYIFNMIKDLDTPKFLVINKIDKMDPDEFKKTFDSYEALGVFDKVLGVSALTGKNVEELIDELAGVMEEGPMYFPEDMFADYPERFLVSEIIREKLLNYLAEEVPHGVAVEIEEYREEEGLTSIGAVIYCEKKSHKGIIIGREGRKLKGIGKAARTEIEGLLGTKVFLRLWVKIKENWRDSDVAIANFGYKDQE